jgi:hypothetical protein
MFGVTVQGIGACTPRRRDARPLWYANQAHGTGPAYTVVTAA